MNNKDNYSQTPIEYIKVFENSNMVFTDSSNYITLVFV